MKIKHKIIGGLLFFVFLTGVIFVVPHEAPEQSPAVFEIDRVVVDFFDVVDAFYMRSSWVADRVAPYSQAQEYPQIGLLYISLPRLIADSQDSYLVWFFVLTACTYFLFVYVLYRLLRLLSLERWRLWLVILPSFLYFSLSRFDLFVALLVLLSLFAAVKKRFTLSMILFGLASLTKWYAVLLVPLVLSWIAKDIPRKQWLKHLGWFFVVVIGLMLTTIIMSGEGALYPYYFHISRGIDGGSMLSLLLPMIAGMLPILSKDAISNVFTQGFFLIQILPLLYGTLRFDAVRKRLISVQSLLRASSGVVLLFVLFGKFYSPQWELWWAPLAFLSARSKKEIALIIIADALNYIQFPLLFQFVGNEIMAYHVVVALRTAVMMWLLYLFAKDFIKKQTSVVPAPNS